MRAGPNELLAGVALDVVLGDPRWMPHPIAVFGWLVEQLEKFWRRTGIDERKAGFLFWFSAVIPAVALVWWTSRLWAPWINIYWIYSMLALRDLDMEAGRVIRAVRRKDLADARRMLARIVGRDTQHLDEPEVLRATIETVAENLNDAVVAPLFYLAIGGPAGMAAYKAINTLDSMVGYRNDRYRDFGWASARIDDAVNYLPARLSAVLLWLAALFLRYDPLRSYRVTVRDAWRQPSPNSGYPEAAMAGALGIRLGGLNYYGGVPSQKEYLGDPVRSLDQKVWEPVRHLLYGAAVLMVAIVWVVLKW